MGRKISQTRSKSEKKFNVLSKIIVVWSNHAKDKVISEEKSGKLSWELITIF